MIKLIALDTDGTLLNSKNKILPSTKAAIRKALDQGVKVVLCSGRPIAGLAHFMKELGIESICRNFKWCNYENRRRKNNDARSCQQ